MAVRVHREIENRKGGDEIMLTDKELQAIEERANKATPGPWCNMENPVGRLVRWIGKPVMIFNPCDYGDPYTKKTCLWGRFNVPVANPVEPVEGSKMWARYGGKSEATKAARSETPMGFARAFFEANQ